MDVETKSRREMRIYTKNVSRDFYRRWGLKASQECSADGGNRFLLKSTQIGM